MAYDQPDLGDFPICFVEQMHGRIACVFCFIGVHYLPTVLVVNSGLDGVYIEWVDLGLSKNKQC